jgi:hypothetical protein
MDFVARRLACNKVDLDLEVLARLAESRVRRLWENHLGLGDTALSVSLVARRQTGHEDGLCAARRSDANGAIGCAEQREHHGDDLCLHLAHTREDIRVDGVRDGEFAKGFGLQADQFVATVVDGATDTAVFPSCVLHVGELGQLLPHRLLAPTLTRQRRDALDARAALDQLALELEQRLGNLRLHFCADSRQSQEDAIQVAADMAIEVCGGAEETAAFELVEGDARPAEHEEDEDNVAQDFEIQDCEAARSRSLARIECIAQANRQA